MIPMRNIKRDWRPIAKRRDTIKKDPP